MPKRSDHLFEHVPWPELSSQVDAALERIAELEPRRARRRRRGVAGLGVGLAVVAAVAASPVRGDVARLFSFGRERIELVDRLAPLRDPRSLELGRRVSLDEARLAAPYRLALPDFAYVGKPSS